MLGYQCVSREILTEASRFFGAPEKKLHKSLHDAPTILDRLTHAREKHLAYIRAALLQYVKWDNVVYHGHAGHLLLPGVSHVLKVRVIAEMGDRIALTRKRLQISEDEAFAFIKSEDRHRSAWTRRLYKTNVSDPGLYDIVLNVSRLRIQDACEMICAAARSDAYTASLESMRALGNLALSSHVRAALNGICKAEVITDGGVVNVSVRGQKLKKTGSANNHIRREVFEQIRADLSKEIIERTLRIPGVKVVACVVDLPYYS
jgi:cytidylate kinase